MKPALRRVRHPHLRPLLLALPAAMALAGCSLGPSQSSYVSRAETIPVTPDATPTSAVTPVNAAMAQAAREALLMLPDGAGAVTKIRERHFVNGTRQEIALAGDRLTHGENVIDVSVRVAEPSARMDNPMTIGKPSESGVRSEILSRFPDVQMNIVTRPMRNALGPFGLAIGRHANGARCVFAWQWVDDLREVSPGTSNLTKLGGLMGGRAMSASIRIRLCRGDQTVDQLAGAIEGLRVGSPDALERIARMDRRSIGSDGPVTGGAGGVQGAPLLKPVGGGLEASLRAQPSRTRVAAAPAPAPRKKVVRAPRPQPVQQARPVAPNVTPAPAYAAPQPAYPMPAQNYGQRYLAPVAGAGAPRPAGGYAPAAAPQYSSANLPPQAYRGPTGAQ